MMKYLKIAAVALLTWAAVSCIKNDIPGPKIELNITAVEGEGFTLSEIDASNRIVTLAIDEATDIQQVRIDKVSYGVVVHSITADKETLIGKIKSSAALTGTFDLRSPIYTTLSLYQDYDWEIRGIQTIDRKFNVVGQIGATVFDLNNRTATAYVSKSADRSAITVTALKLNAEGKTTYSPSLEELSGSNFETVRFVDITCHGREERWLLYVVPTDKTVELTHADPGSKVIWLYGEGEAGQKMGFRYRKAGGSDWTTVEAVADGGNFKTTIATEPETTYEVKAYSGSDETAPIEVTTDPATPLFNGGLENWCTLDYNGKDVIYPYLATESPYWGTGNQGASVANATLTQSSDPRPGSAGRYSAHLKSTKATIFGIGKFAAGNLFLGDYITNDVTNGILRFGRASNLRPRYLRFWVKYNRGLIDIVDKNPVGTTFVPNVTPDNGTVYIALGTWTKEEYGVVPTTVPDVNYSGKIAGTDASPVVIATRDASTFFKSNSKDVVAYGEWITDKSVEEWQQVTIEIKYNSTHIRPTNMLIVCSASRWGDYFTGSTKSEMWLDDMELIYE